MKAQSPLPSSTQRNDQLSRIRIVLSRTSHPGNIGAAARAMKDSLKGQRVGVIISGGNVDLDRYCALLAPEPRP